MKRLNLVLGLLGAALLCAPANAAESSAPTRHRAGPVTPRRCGRWFGMRRVSASDCSGSAEGSGAD